MKWRELSNDEKADKRSNRIIWWIVIVGIILFIIWPIEKNNQRTVLNMARVLNIKHLKHIIQSTIQFNNGDVYVPPNIHCIDDRLIKELGIPSELLKDGLPKEPNPNWINYGTKVWGCKWKYWFVYNEEQWKIWIIATMWFKTKQKWAKQWNANIDLDYYKHFPRKNLETGLEEDKKDFIDAFNKNKWKLWNHQWWNSYVEIIDINKIK